MASAQFGAGSAIPEVPLPSLARIRLEDVAGTHPAATPVESALADVPFLVPSLDQLGPDLIAQLGAVAPLLVLRQRSGGYQLIGGFRSFQLLVSNGAREAYAHVYSKLSTTGIAAMAARSVTLAAVVGAIGGSHQRLGELKDLLDSVGTSALLTAPLPPPRRRSKSEGQGLAATYADAGSVPTRAHAQLSEDQPS